MRNKSTFNTDLKNTYNEFWQKKKQKNKTLKINTNLFTLIKGTHTDTGHYR